jgi:hypothetical protein
MCRDCDAQVKKRGSQKRVWMLREPRVTERGLVPLDTHKLREQAIKACARAAKAFEKDDRALKDFEQRDIPAFERWKARTIGPLVTEFQRLDTELREAEFLRNIAMDEGYSMSGFVGPHDFVRLGRFDCWPNT